MWSINFHVTPSLLVAIDLEAFFEFPKESEFGLGTVYVAENLKPTLQPYLEPKFEWVTNKIELVNIIQGEHVLITGIDYHYNTYRILVESQDYSSKLTLDQLFKNYYFKETGKPFGEYR